MNEDEHRIFRLHSIGADVLARQGGRITHEQCVASAAVRCIPADDLRVAVRLARLADRVQLLRLFDAYRCLAWCHVKLIVVVGEATSFADLERHVRSMKGPPVLAWRRLAWRLIGRRREPGAIRRRATKSNRGNADAG